MSSCVDTCTGHLFRGGVSIVTELVSEIPQSGKASQLIFVYTIIRATPHASYDAMGVARIYGRTPNRVVKHHTSVGHGMIKEPPIA